MRPHQTAPGAGRRARRCPLSVLPLIGAGCVLALALPGRGPGSSLHGAGASWQTAAMVAGPSRPMSQNSLVGSFGISGSIGGLYPGATQLLLLTVSNPQRFAIVVNSISTSVGSPNAGCAPLSLTVASFSGQLRILAGGSAHVAVPVALSRATPDACQGAVFPLTYSGLAGKA